LTVHEFTNKKAIQLLATQSRRIDITPWELSSVHVELGKFLVYQIIEEFELEEIKIQHPQGIKIGKKIKNEKDIIILDCIRAGIYMGDGLRHVFQNSPYYHISPNRKEGLDEKEINKLPSLKNKSIILLDSVINTGETMIPIIRQLLNQNPSRIIISCIVIYCDTVKKIEKLFPELSFYFARISTNFYIGKGKTDTGNRLFGTF